MEMVCAYNSDHSWHVSHRMAYEFHYMANRTEFYVEEEGVILCLRVKKSVQVCIWFIVILVTWKSLFNSNHVDRSKTATKVLDYVTWTIVALLIGSILWLLKNLVIKILAASFHVRHFFDRIQESIFLQYVLVTLSGPPLMESLQNAGASTSKSQFRVIDVSKLHKIEREKVSDDELEETGIDKEIRSEMDAIAAAYHIFRYVAQPGSRYIEDIDLMRFMIKEEVDNVFPMIDVADKRQIDQRTLTEWVIKVYNERKALAHMLDETKRAVNELNKLLIAILIVIMIIVWLLLTGFATTKVLVFLSSQVVVAAFIFGNTCKTVFEAIIFVFIMHPFDVGDRCVIDGVQMVVEQMNMLGTVFLRFDNEMIYYPNSVLATKPISNLHRCPDMGDSVEFYIDFATPVEKIELLKDKIRKYLMKNHKLWYTNQNIVVKDIEK